VKLSTKGRYAVTALADIALNGTTSPVALGEIAERQDISLAYLEQLFVRLRRAGLVVSARGPGGGYRLARPAREIRIAEIMVAVDERLNAMGCNGKYDEGMGCGSSREACLTHALWEQLSAHVHVFLARISIADVIAARMSPCPAVPDFTAFIEEDAEVEETAA
jgi:Rrf2 family transcriptional regulator, iron-sulfur cluster assembly transcription factor